MEKIQADQIYTPRDKRGLLGRGSFGVVRLCKTEKLGYIAAKCFCASQDKQNKSRIAGEAAVLQRVRHKNIVQFYGTVEWDDSVAILTEYVVCGNLDGLLRNPNLPDIPWVLRLRIATELSEAISWIHSGYKPGKSFVHGDIKPDNVLLSNDLTVKLADFGAANLAVHTGASSMSLVLPNNRQCTAFYSAPEFLQNPRLPRRSDMDVYSFAMVLYEIASRRRVFENAQLPQSALFRVIIERGQRPDESFFGYIFRTLDSSDLPIFRLLIKIMKTCWAKQPSDRPSMTTVRGILIKKSEDIEPDDIKEQAIIVRKNLNMQTNLAVDSSWTTMDHFCSPFVQTKASLARVPSLSWGLQEKDFLRLLCVNNCLKFRACAMEYNYKILKHQANVLIALNLATLTRTPEFEDLEFSSLMEIFQEMKKSQGRVMYNAAIAWTNYDAIRRKRNFFKLFQQIKLNTLPQKFLTAVIIKESLVRNSFDCCRLLMDELSSRLVETEDSSIVPTNGPNCIGTGSD